MTQCGLTGVFHLPSPALGSGLTRDQRQAMQSLPCDFAAPVLGEEALHGQAPPRCRLSCWCPWRLGGLGLAGKYTVTASSEPLHPDLAGLLLLKLTSLV